MSFDMSRINSIENNLKTNISNVSTNDLIYYLKYNTKNEKLDDTNLENTEKYLSDIQNSFFYENVFVNTNNYTSIIISVIGLLIPFYFFYPRMYKIGFFGYIIGFMSLLNIITQINGLYSNFFSNAQYYFIGLTFFIYLVFFILFNKLNHISLFFISALIAFLILNYIYRLILTIPFDSNMYNKYRATLKNNISLDANETFVQYNVLLETTCLELIKRLNLKLPSGNMLYSYLTVFEMGENTNKISDFVSNIFSPLISIFILLILGRFLSTVKSNEINIFPIIGINEESISYLTCSANYILPKELNVSLLIHDLIDQYNLDDKTYNKVEKSLLRISKELLSKYNPKFRNLENSDKKNILNNLEDNKIYNQIKKLLKNCDINHDDFVSFTKNARDCINSQNITYKVKSEMFDLLEHIDNTLVIINEENKEYNNDIQMAIDELMYDKDIDDKYKNKLKDIVTLFKTEFLKNLQIKGNKLYGYYHNISGYSLFGKELGNKIKYYSNKGLTLIIGLISTWILFAKPFGSAWLLMKYILSDSYGFIPLLKDLTGETTLWKYISMGLDTSFFEEKYIENIENNGSTFIEKSLNIVYTVIGFLFIFPILYMYNSITFGSSSSPLWYNIIYQMVFIMNIIGNFYMYNAQKSLLTFNIIFIIAIVLIGIIYSIINYFIK